MVIIGTTLQENKQIMDSISKEDYQFLIGKGMRKEEKIKIINLANDSQYKSQIDNKIIPSGTCNVTSMAMSGELIGLKEFNGFNISAKYKQIEDRMSYFIMNDLELKRLYESKEFTWYRNQDYKPMEIHAILSKGINKFYTGSSESTITYFSTNNTLLDLVSDIVLKLTPFVSSGLFYKYAHIVCFNGIITSQMDIFQVKEKEDISLKDIRGFIYDDPFGQMKTKYQKRNGNDQIMTIEEFTKNINHKGKINKKWSHRFNFS